MHGIINSFKVIYVQRTLARQGSRDLFCQAFDGPTGGFGEDWIIGFCLDPSPELGQIIPIAAIAHSDRHVA